MKHSYIIYTYLDASIFFEVYATAQLRAQTTQSRDVHEQHQASTTRQGNGWKYIKPIWWVGCMYSVDKDTRLLMASMADGTSKHGRHVNSTIHQFRSAKDHMRLKKKTDFCTKFWAKKHPRIESIIRSHFLMFVKNRKWLLLWTIIRGGVSRSKSTEEGYKQKKDYDKKRK